MPGKSEPVPFKELPGKVTTPEAPASPDPSIEMNCELSARKIRRLTVPLTNGLPNPAQVTLASALAHHTVPLVGDVMTRPENGGDAKVSRGEELEIVELICEEIRME